MRVCGICVRVLSMLCVRVYVCAYMCACMYVCVYVCVRMGTCVGCARLCFVLRKLCCTIRVVEEDTHFWYGVALKRPASCGFFQTGKEKYRRYR